MTKKITKHQKLVIEKVKTFKVIRKEIKELVKKYGQDNVRYSLNKWLTEERDRRYWLKQKGDAEKELREIKKKLK